MTVSYQPKLCLPKKWPTRPSYDTSPANWWLAQGLYLIAFESLKNFQGLKNFKEVYREHRISSFSLWNYAHSKPNLTYALIPNGIYIVSKCRLELWTDCVFSNKKIYCYHRFPSFSLWNYAHGKPLQGNRKKNWQQPVKIVRQSGRTFQSKAESQ